MSKATHIILLGVGGFGRRWVEAVGSMRRVKVVGLVDPDREALTAAADKLNVPLRHCFGELAAAMELDFEAAIVCTPPSTRPAIYRTLARAGKHILVEKPLAADMTAARAAVALKRRTAVRFAVAQNYRYRPCIQAARRLIASGKFGSPGACYVDFHRHPVLRGFRQKMPHPLLIDMSIHHFDLARYVLGADPRRVLGSTWTAPWSQLDGDGAATVTFEMTGGVRLAYNGSWITLRPQREHTTWTGDWTIECEHGCVMIRDDRLYAGRWRLDASGRPRWGKLTTPPMPRARDEQAQVLCDFLDSISNGTDAPTSVEDNIRSLAMVFAAVKAADAHRQVDVAKMIR